MKKIDKYNITGELGRGAMGIVYKAEDPDIGRALAIKTIRFDAPGQRPDLLQAQERFMREARSAGNLSHANIVTIYEVGKDKDFSYIAMEYVDGKSLEELMASRHKFSQEEIFSLLRQIGEALDYAHRKGVVHRDVKPGNILLGQDGKPHLVDFGIARLSTSNLTQTSTVIGTPNYMSPEQITGKTIDGRSDIFSLGVILYELLTGQKPFKGDDITTVMYKIVNEDPPAIREFEKSIPGGLEYVLRKALAKTPESRHQTCEELFIDVRNHKMYEDIQLPSEPVKAERIIEPEYAPPHPPKERSRKPLLFLLIAMMAVVITVIVVVFLNYSQSRSYSGGKGGVVTPVVPPKTDEIVSRRKEQEIRPEKKDPEIIAKKKNEHLNRVKTKPRPDPVKSREDYENAALAAIVEEDREKVERTLDAGFRHYPKSAKLWSIRALYYLFSDDIPNHEELALKTAKYALSLDGDEPQCYAVLKSVYEEINNGQNINEFKDIENAVAAKHPEYYIAMARSYEKWEMESDALIYYWLYLRAEPTHRNAEEARKRVAELSIEHTKLEMPRELRNKKPPLTEKDAVKLAWDAFKKRDKGRMLQILQDSIYYYPESDRLWAAYSTYFFMYDRPEADLQALKYANIALALNPRNPENSSGLGWIYQLKFKDYATAYFHYKKAESLGLKKPELYYNLGFCADQLRDRNSAINYYTRFVQTAPNNKRVPQAKSRIKALRGY